MRMAFSPVEEKKTSRPCCKRAISIVRVEVFAAAEAECAGKKERQSTFPFPPPGIVALWPQRKGCSGFSPMSSKSTLFLEAKLKSLANLQVQEAAVLSCVCWSVRFLPETLRTGGGGKNGSRFPGHENLVEKGGKNLQRKLPQRREA